MRKKEKNCKKQSQYIEGIDGLRAIAVLMIFAYHLRLPFAKGGLLGVTVFFVISGFLITRILVSELEETGRIDIMQFWFRRVIRLFPAVLVMATVSIFVSAVFNRVLFTRLCSDLPSVILGYNNWWQIFNKVSYFDNTGAPSPLAHCWPLAIEIQFYLVYPLLLVFLRRFKNFTRMAEDIMFVAGIDSLGAMWILFDPVRDPGRIYYGTDTRIFALLFGVLLAFVTMEDRPGEGRGRIWRNVAGIVSLPALLYMMIRVDGCSAFLYKGGHGIASVCTALVIFSLMDEDGILGRLLSFSVLKWIGDRSYGIYLWHYPIILLLSNGVRSSWWVNIVEILQTVIIADLSYRYIETPIRHGVIEKSIAVIRRRPRSLRERKEQDMTLKRSIGVAVVTLVIAVGVLLCVIFVPRQSASDDVGNMEKQAEKVSREAALNVYR